MAYVYRHIRLDKNEPFYIGISNEKSGKYYRAFSRLRNTSSIWNRIVAKTEYYVEVLIDNISWEDACEKEKEFIRLYGRIDLGTGTLANMTDGGEGNAGLIITPELRVKYGNGRRGKKNCPQSNLRRSQTQKGKYVSIETRAKISNSRKGVRMSDKQKLHLSMINKGKKPSIETIEKIKETKSQRTYIYVGRKKSEEEKRKIGDYHKGKKWSLGEKRSDEYKKWKSSITITKKPVIKYTVDGEFIEEYGSQREAAIKMGGNFQKEAIGRACKGITRGYKNHKYKGYIWKYKTQL